MANTRVTKVTSTTKAYKGNKASELDIPLQKESVEDTLRNRGSRYGEFHEQARITQNLKLMMRDSPNWNGLESIQKEALEMTAHKIARILNGDPNYIDSHHDIQGYLKLVEDHLVETGKAT